MKNFYKLFIPLVFAIGLVVPTPSASEVVKKSDISGSINIKIEAGNIKNILTNTNSSRGRVQIGSIKHSDISGSVQLDKITVGEVVNELSNTKNSTATVKIGVIQNSTITDAKIRVDLKKVGNKVSGGTNNHGTIRIGTIEDSAINGKVGIDIYAAGDVTNIITRGSNNHTEVSIGSIFAGDDEEGLVDSSSGRKVSLQRQGLAGQYTQSGFYSAVATMNMNNPQIKSRKSQIASNNLSIEGKPIRIQPKITYPRKLGKNWVSVQQKKLIAKNAGVPYMGPDIFYPGITDKDRRKAEEKWNRIENIYKSYHAVYNYAVELNKIRSRLEALLKDKENFATIFKRAGGINNPNNLFLQLANAPEKPAGLSQEEYRKYLLQKLYKAAKLTQKFIDETKDQDKFLKRVLAGYKSGDHKRGNTRLLKQSGLLVLNPMSASYYEFSRLLDKAPIEKVPGAFIYKTGINLFKLPTLLKINNWSANPAATYGLISKQEIKNYNQLAKGKMKVLQNRIVKSAMVEPVLDVINTRFFFLPTLLTSTEVYGAKMPKIPGKSKPRTKASPNGRGSSDRPPSSSEYHQGRIDSHNKELEKLYRGDRNPYSQNAITRGNKKPHIKEDGSLVAANSKGKTSMEEHVMGNNLKSSRYISLSTSETVATKFGKTQPFEVNYKALLQDKPRGVKVYTTDEIVRHLDDKISRARGLAKNKLNSIKDRQTQLTLIKKLEKARSNVNGNKEVLVEGTVPAKYITRLPPRPTK